jgi:hypothetical protein
MSDETSIESIQETLRELQAALARLQTVQKSLETADPKTMGPKAVQRIFNAVRCDVECLAANLEPVIGWMNLLTADPSAFAEIAKASGISLEASAERPGADAAISVPPVDGHRATAETP